MIRSESLLSCLRFISVICYLVSCLMTFAFDILSLFSCFMPLGFYLWYLVSWLFSLISGLWSLLSLCVFVVLSLCPYSHQPPLGPYISFYQVDAKIPEGEGQDDAYVLFYRRSGLPFTVNIPEQLTNSAPAEKDSPELRWLLVQGMSDTKRKLLVLLIKTS